MVSLLLRGHSYLHKHISHQSDVRVCEPALSRSAAFDQKEIGLLVAHGGIGPANATASGGATRLQRPRRPPIHEAEGQPEFHGYGTVPLASSAQCHGRIGAGVDRRYIRSRRAVDHRVCLSRPPLPAAGSLGRQDPGPNPMRPAGTHPSIGRCSSRATERVPGRATGWPRSRCRCSRHRA